MGDNHNVLITWSGPRSRWAAEALREWLPLVLQSTKPWMSETDIEKGARWLDEMGRAINGIRVGIICLTPENLDHPWILFEAGILSKALDPRTRVCTYLLGDLRPQDVKQPLAMFQASTATKNETKKMLRSINHALEVPIGDAILDTVFESMWEKLEKGLAQMPRPDEIVEAKRPIEEMVAEILEYERAADKRRREATFIEAYEPVLKDLLPFLAEFLKQVRNARTHQTSHSADTMVQTDAATAALNVPEQSL
jgi:hypothetical protein